MKKEVARIDAVADYYAKVDLSKSGVKEEKQTEQSKNESKKAATMV